MTCVETTVTRTRGGGFPPSSCCVLRSIGVAVVCLLCASVALADAVKVGGLWIEGASVRDISNGQLVFRSPGGAVVRRPLYVIQGIRLDTYPALGEAFEHLDNDRHAEAVTSLRDVIDDARPDWLVAYARSVLVAAAIRADDAEAAALAYARLAAGGADPALLPEPPAEAVRAAADDVKPRIAERVRVLMSDVPRDRREAVQLLIDAATAAEGEAIGGPAPERGPDESAVVLPVILEEDAITRSLRAGDFEAAAQQARRALRSTGGTSRELYQLGVALLGIADRTGEPDAYKTAALPLMRVVIHFAGGSRLTDYARVEAAYCHLNFGRPDIAADLLATARNAITEADDADYAARIDRLVQQLGRGE